MIFHLESPATCPASLSKVMNNTEVKFNSSYVKITQLERNAYESSRNATDIKKRAEELLAMLKNFMKDLDGRFLKFQSK